jgi:hypothetical protein
MNKLIIEYEDIALLIKGAKAITMNPQGEEILVKLLDLKDKVEKALVQAKSVLAVAMEEIDPELTSISSDRIKVMNRVYGAKYSLDDMLIESLDESLYTTKTSYSPVATEIEKVIKTTGVLPTGIRINERAKTVSISSKEIQEVIE